MREVPLDVLIIGGGAAGLWLLDELSRRGRQTLLLEAHALGSGQTVASQGIIHGGLKYTLRGLLTRSAESIREMPALWRECLAGRTGPDLSGTRLRAAWCHLWRTDSVRSRLGMLGARFGLRVAPQLMPDDQRPAVLAGCPGVVARLDEPVIAPDSFLAQLVGPHWISVLKIDAEDGICFDVNSAGHVQAVEIKSIAHGRRAVLRPDRIVLTAGAGNARLREQLGLPPQAMQRRPLHMVLVRGRLPELNGHCVDGARTRATITTDRDTAGRTVWQVGGQIAEDGVSMDARALLAHARHELQQILPGLDLSGVEWAARRVDRAEARTSTGARPDTVQILDEANILTAWPTKLALAPLLARRLADQIVEAACPSKRAVCGLDDWPRPDVARPPWESCGNWQRLVEPVAAARQESAA